MIEVIHNPPDSSSHIRYGLRIDGDVFNEVLDDKLLIVYQKTTDETSVYVSDRALSRRIAEHRFDEIPAEIHSIALHPRYSALPQPEVFVVHP